MSESYILIHDEEILAFACSADDAKVQCETIAEQRPLSVAYIDIYKRIDTYMPEKNHDEQL